MRILVTGGMGFIGSHLVEWLVRESHEVTVVDNLSNPVEGFELPISARQYIGTVTEFWYEQVHVEQFRTANYNFDQIYHLASPVGPAGVLKYAGRMVQEIISDTYTLIEMASMMRAKLVFVSTSEVYGGGVNGLCGETMPRIIQAETTVRLEYAVAKLAAETALINTCKVNNNLDAVIVRPFNVAGPRQGSAGGFVLPRFIEQALSGKPLTVFGTGDQVRAFTHVTDIVDGLISAMENGERGEVYNLGNPANRTTILDLARRVIRLTDSESEYVFVDPRSIYGPLYAEASDKYPSAVKSFVGLNWQPQFGIDWTIIDTVDYMMEKVTI